MLTAEYVAGFFDGEGNVGIYAGGGTGRTLRAQITQADSQDAYALLFEMRARWGDRYARSTGHFAAMRGITKWAVTVPTRCFTGFSRTSD
jgi:hypothetical protein